MENILNFTEEINKRTNKLNQYLKKINIFHSKLKHNNYNNSDVYLYLACLDCMERENIITKEEKIKVNLCLLALIKE